jgi:hypothetical protein
VNGSALCGFSDWRMPGGDELLGIVDSTRSLPAINPTYFPPMRRRRPLSQPPAKKQPDTYLDVAARLNPLKPAPSFPPASRCKNKCLSSFEFP